MGVTIPNAFGALMVQTCLTIELFGTWMTLNKERPTIPNLNKMAAILNAHVLSSYFEWFWPYQWLWPTIGNPNHSKSECQNVGFPNGIRLEHSVFKPPLFYIKDNFVLKLLIIQKLSAWYSNSYYRMITTTIFSFEYQT